MIRIKCPKCSITLSLDDEEAGQVGQCTDCGARFRVPARKPAAGRPAKETAAKRPPPSRSRDDEDDEDDEDADDQEEEVTKGAKRPKSKKDAESGMQAIVTRVVFLVAVGILGVGGVLINNLAVLVGAFSLILAAVCGLLVGRGAKHLIVPCVGFVLLLAVSVGAWYVREGRIDEQHKRLRVEMDSDVPQPR